MENDRNGAGMVTGAMETTNRRLSKEKREIFDPERDLVFDASRCKRNEQVLINGERGFVIPEPTIVPAIPDAGERIRRGHCLAITPPGQRGAALTGVVRNGHGKAFVLRRRPERRLAGA